jgi:hypothetical protein
VALDATLLGKAPVVVTLLSYCFLDACCYEQPLYPLQKQNIYFFLIPHNKVLFNTKYNCTFYLVTEHGNFLA